MHCSRIYNLLTMEVDYFQTIKVYDWKIALVL